MEERQKLKHWYRTKQRSEFPLNARVPCGKNLKRKKTQSQGPKQLCTSWSLPWLRAFWLADLTGLRPGQRGGQMEPECGSIWWSAKYWWVAYQSEFIYPPQFHLQILTVVLTHGRNIWSIPVLFTHKFNPHLIIMSRAPCFRRAYSLLNKITMMSKE